MGTNWKRIIGGVSGGETINMCGICGIVSHSPNFRIDKSMIVNMCDRIVHRGPDAEGYYVEDQMAFGMRRLRIIDLKTGDQPIFNEDKTIGVVFNGEIYNYMELKKDLIKKGHQFYTNADTEVLVHLYEEMGEGLVEKLRGMFAFAIWDKNKTKVFIARDRLGIKPLYYMQTPKYFIFASELKSILGLPFVAREINFDALSDYFTFLYVPAPLSIFKNINKLPSAHYMTLDGKGAIIKRYWALRFENKSIGKDENECIEEFLSILEGSVRCRLISDVPLGAFLSGGIDSSLIVAMMSRFSDRPVETFSIGYEGSGAYFDERKYSQIISERFGTHHHEFILKPPNIEELLEKIIPQFDEPFADASAIPNFILSKETRKYVTVALSGLGGDELCGGYERYIGCLLAEKYRKLPGLLTGKMIPKMAGWLPDSKKGSHFSERLKRFVNSANLPFLVRYFEIVGAFSEKEKGSLFAGGVVDLITRPSSKIFHDFYSELPQGSDPINSMSFLDLNTYLVDDLLTLTDRMSMANSLEARVPLIDHHMVEFFAGIPASLRVRKYSKKYLLKKAAERLLPREVIYRKKMGFSVPLVVWFRGEIRNYVKEVLSESNLRKLEFFNYSYVSRVLDDHFSGRRNYDEKIWALINFAKWYETYLQ